MLHRKRLPNRTWAALCDDDQYLEPTPQREACWLVAMTFVWTGLLLAALWLVGCFEQVVTNG
jgi:hypothetical protein